MQSYGTSKTVNLAKEKDRSSYLTRGDRIKPSLQLHCNALQFGKTLLPATRNKLHQVLHASRENHTYSSEIEAADMNSEHIAIDMKENLAGLEDGTREITKSNSFSQRQQSQNTENTANVPRYMIFRKHSPIKAILLPCRCLFSLISMRLLL